MALEQNDRAAIRAETAKRARLNFGHGGHRFPLAAKPRGHRFKVRVM